MAVEFLAAEQVITADKDVMMTLVGASGATAGIGLAFVGVIAAILGLKTDLRPRLKALTIAAMVAFILALLSTLFALACVGAHEISPDPITNFRQVVDG